jgi:predicted nucleic acid-binding protein
MIDSNVILDIVTKDPVWFEWSSKLMRELASSHIFIINSIIYSEVSIGFERIEEVEELFVSTYFTREPIPWEACFLAGKCFLQYRKKGGVKTNPLPDFFIGSHALINGYRLLTRDTARYKTYFPKLKLITPE